MLPSWSFTLYKKASKTPGEVDSNSALPNTNVSWSDCLSIIQRKDKISKYTFLKLFSLFTFDRALGDLLIAVPHLSKTSWKVLTIKISLASRNEKYDYKVYSLWASPMGLIVIVDHLFLKSLFSHHRTVLFQLFPFFFASSSPFFPLISWLGV